MQHYKQDQYGHLCDFNDWDAKWVQLVLFNHPLFASFSLQHLKILNLIRTLFVELGRVPPQRILFKAIKNLPEFTSFDSIVFHEMFSSESFSPLQQLCLLAGLPPPQHCI